MTDVVDLAKRFPGRHFLKGKVTLEFERRRGGLDCIATNQRLQPGSPRSCAKLPSLVTVTARLQAAALILEAGAAECDSQLQWGDSMTR